jgi:hypothetical protein
MAPSSTVAALGAGAASMGAALAVSLVVTGMAEILAVGLSQEDEEEEEDHTEAEWATARLNKLRLRSRQLRQQRRHNCAKQAYEAPLFYTRFQWGLAMISDDWVKKRMRFTTAEIERILSLLYLKEVE